VGLLLLRGRERETELRRQFSQRGSLPEPWESLPGEALVRTYFRLGAHHIRFNVVDTDTLRDAQAHPDLYRDLLVRVAGYSDYFVDTGRNSQENIILRTTQGVL
jgi:hypothetical protein